MNTFQHQLWGYQINLPDTWQHQTFGHKDGFSEDPEAFHPGYEGKQLAQLLINGEWNCLQMPIYDIWQKHLGKTSLMLGAKNLGAGTWEMAGASGYEVEIVLPKKNPHRLWTGILENKFLLLTFLVLHRKENQKELEPLLSMIIASLKFLDKVDKIQQGPMDLPLPSLVVTADPQHIVSDIPDPENWLAFQGELNIGALQAFYLRELPHLGWSITRYVPYPNPGGLSFSRLLLEKDGQSFSLGLMPPAEGKSDTSIVLKTGT